jgi:hypothetical protein
MHLALLRRLSILAAMACSQSCWAIPIQVNYEAAFVPSGGEQPLPIYVDNKDPNPDSVRFRLSVPDAAKIGSLNSVRVLVDVYDDGDAANNETGEVLFILNGTGQSNFTVASFGSGLNGTTSGSSLTVEGWVESADFDDVLAEITDDGIFFVRLNRTGGDYFVQDATVTIDANLVPEPATAILVGVGLLAVVGAFSNRSRAPRRGRRAEHLQTSNVFLLVFFPIAIGSWFTPIRTRFVRALATAAGLAAFAASGLAARAAQYTAVDLYPLQPPAGWNQAGPAFGHQTAFAGQVVGAAWEPRGSRPTRERTRRRIRSSGRRTARRRT